VSEGFLVEPVMGRGLPLRVVDRDFVDFMDFVDLVDVGEVGRGGKGTDGGIDGKSSVLSADLRE
jgi:hypothetical protein